jgi:DMSO reductase anchor subunit
MCPHTVHVLIQVSEFPETNPESVCVLVLLLCVLTLLYRCPHVSSYYYIYVSSYYFICVLITGGASFWKLTQKVRACSGGQR